jgi:hypothetical protein
MLMGGVDWPEGGWRWALKRLKLLDMPCQSGKLGNLDKSGLHKGLKQTSE